MGSDKARDDKYFNCSEKHEIDYVARLYPDSDKVRAFLIESCSNGKIKYSTNKEIYELIKKELGYPVPVST